MWHKILYHLRLTVILLVLLFVSFSFIIKYIELGIKYNSIGDVLGDSK